MIINCDSSKAFPLADRSVKCVVTSPPYWGLRDYGHDGQIGLESTPREYVSRIVDVFHEVKRVLRDDGVVWLNLGDSWATGGRGGGGGDVWDGKKTPRGWRSAPPGLKHKDRVGIPWQVAFALRDDGWYLRQDIIWSKPNPMPESVRDRCTSSHEYIFLLTKSARYYYDADAIAEIATETRRRGDSLHGCKDTNGNSGLCAREPDGKRNARSVWVMATQPYSGAHFATFPEALPERCILAGSRGGDVVLDPFGGSGTTVKVAERLGRHGVAFELNPEYCALARERTWQESRQMRIV